MIWYIMAHIAIISQYSDSYYGDELESIKYDLFTL